jgi:N-acetylmuramoyl-L-alanine amidase
MRTRIRRYAAIGCLMALLLQGRGNQMALSAAPVSDGDGVIIYLDAGHDSSHGGCHVKKLKEEVLTLKIACYCKEELEKYEGVTVYMSRETEACPNPGTGSISDNAARVADAASKHADIYVALHLDSAPSSKARGATVYYPNASYHSELSDAGKLAAESILKQLTALGIKNNGARVRNSEDHTTYADGSLADYYGIIKGSKQRGMTGIIVEHAYMSNSSDVSSFLNSDAKLKKLGIADAKGIAEAYGLTRAKSTRVSLKSVTQESFDEILVTWNEYPDADSYIVYRRSDDTEPWSKIAETTDTEYVDEDFTPGETYYYTIKAYDEDTDSYSKKSANGLSVETKSQLPQNVTIVSKKGKGVQLVWDAVDSATGYIIYRTDADGNRVKLGRTKKTSYSDLTVSGKTEYTYSIRAYQKLEDRTIKGTYDIVGYTVMTKAGS